MPVIGKQKEKLKSQEFEVVLYIFMDFKHRIKSCYARLQILIELIPIEYLLCLSIKQLHISHWFALITYYRLDPLNFARIN